jgi:tetratricopeptide (TPR) repeat protein
MASSFLDRAASLAARGKNAELVALLEPQLPLYRDSKRFYLLLGIACLRAGDASGAWTYLKRAEQLEAGDPLAMLGLAALHLRRGETERAAALYLAVLEKKPRDRLALEALAFMRRPDAAELVAGMIDDGGFERFYPGAPNPARRLLPLLLALMALALVAGIALSLPGLLGRLAPKGAERPEIAAISLSGEEREDPVGTGGSYRYVLTEAQALASFDKAKTYFAAYRDNAALVELNRILGSNARTALKDKAATLKSYAAAPDWRNLRDVPGFDEVAADPWLHDGLAVSWKGRAANIRKEGPGRGFDFLAGYEGRQKLLGIVPALAEDPALALPGDRAFELLAVVRGAEAGKFSLEVIAIHELMDEEE